MNYKKASLTLATLILFATNGSIGATTLLPTIGCDVDKRLGELIDSRKEKAKETTPVDFIRPQNLLHDDILPIWLGEKSTWYNKEWEILVVLEKTEVALDAAPAPTKKILRVSLRNICEPKQLRAEGKIMIKEHQSDSQSDSEETVLKSFGVQGSFFSHLSEPIYLVLSFLTSSEHPEEEGKVFAEFLLSEGSQTTLPDEFELKPLEGLEKMAQKP